MALGLKVEVAGTWTTIPWQPIPCQVSFKFGRKNPFTVLFPFSRLNLLLFQLSVTLDGLWEKELHLGVKSNFHPQIEC